MAILDIRPECERCGNELPNGAPDARICTFECTFCATCTDGELAGICPTAAGTSFTDQPGPKSYSRNIP
jgi:hypothetical protein